MSHVLCSVGSSRCLSHVCGVFFFFKQKTAYEMRISDWSSDVCSSDLRMGHAHCVEAFEGEELVGGLYGVSLGSAFFGESMFSRRTNASKICLEIGRASCRERVCQYV